MLFGGIGNRNDQENIIENLSSNWAEYILIVIFLIAGFGWFVGWGGNSLGFVIAFLLWRITELQNAVIALLAEIIISATVKKKTL